MPTGVMRSPGFLLWAMVVAGSASGDPPINWFCDSATSNMRSSGAPIDATFRFELGVFGGSFIPTPANVDQWAAHWAAAQRVSYVPTGGQPQATGSFTGVYQVTGNPEPFIQGRRAYIWGFNADYVNAEWILISDTAWTWPLASFLDPIALEWNVADAGSPGEVILGSINPSGSPFLMQTASVPVAAPPPTSWAQWRNESFGSAALADPLVSGPAADPDSDGQTNLEEYAYATPPLGATPFLAVTPSILTVGNAQHLALTVPVKSDRVILLEIGWSSDLATWDYAPARTVLVDSSPVGHTYRCTQPVTAGPAGFLRARIRLP
jgi:hypothetical protein